MTQKIGHSLEKFYAHYDTDEIRAAIRWGKEKNRKETPTFSQTYTIECPHCRKFFEFQLEVKR